MEDFKSGDLVYILQPEFYPSNIDYDYNMWHLAMKVVQLDDFLTAIRNEPCYSLVLSFQYEEYMQSISNRNDFSHASMRTDSRGNRFITAYVPESFLFKHNSKNLNKKFSQKLTTMD